MLRKIAIGFVLLVILLVTLQLGLLTKKSAENYGGKAQERHDSIYKFKRGE